MKKATVIILTLALTLILAACGGNSNEPAANDTPQIQETADPTPTEIPTPEPTPDPTLEATPDDGNSIPDNGTPPTVTAPLESHAGDMGYFYTVTDDYIVWESYADNYTIYRMYVFDADGEVIDRFEKYVFTNETDAKTFADVQTWRVQVGNVVYNDGSVELGEWMGRQDKSTQIYTIPISYDNYYISKPVGGYADGTYFPNIDDSLLPANFLKFTVGALANSEVLSIPDYNAYFLRFVDITEDDYSNLTSLYRQKADSTAMPPNPMADPLEYEYTYEWGFIKLVYSKGEGAIEVTIYCYL